MMQVEEGKIIKCPGCGMIIDDRTSLCPACGTPIVWNMEGSGNDEIDEFVAELKEYDLEIASLPPSGKSLFSLIYWPTSIWGQIGWVLLCLAFLGFPLLLSAVYRMYCKNDTLNKAEKMKAAVIKNASFGTSSTNAEALRIASEQLILLGSEKNTSTITEWARIWKAKAEEFYRKAKKGNEDPERIESYMNTVEKASKDILGARKKWIIVLCVWGFFALMFIVAVNSTETEDQTDTTPQKSVTAPSSNDNSISAAEVQGKYIGETGSVIVVHADGTATYYWYGWDDLYENNKWRIENGKLVIEISAVKCEVTADIVKPNSETVFASKSMNWDDEKFVYADNIDAKYTTEECDAFLKQYFGDAAEKAVEKVLSSGMDTYTCDNVKFFFPSGTEMTDGSNCKNICWNKDIELSIGVGTDTVSAEALVKNGDAIVDNLFNKMNMKGTKIQHYQYTIAGYQAVANDYSLEQNLFLKVYVITEPERGKYVWIVSLARSKDLLSDVDTLFAMAKRDDDSETSGDLGDINLYGVSSSVKQTLDAYEAFVDEYIAFSNKYSEASEPLSMYNEYMEMELKFIEWETKLLSLMNGISDKDLLYLDLVIYRTMDKMDKKIVK